MKLFLVQFNKQKNNLKLNKRTSPTFLKIVFLSMKNPNVIFVRKT